MAIEYYFPNDSAASEIPVWMTFKAARYSSFVAERTRGHVLSNAAVSISVPYPFRFSTRNSQRYMTGKYGDSEGLFDKTEYDLKESETDNAFAEGLGIFSYDHVETVLTPGARRTHVFDMNLVAKTAAHAEAISKIGLAFQTYMYPGTFTESILNMTHPPLWYFYASGTNISPVKWYWDGNPLVSVLESVDINHSPISNTPFMTTDYKPLAINIKLQFIELEPAMQLGDGTLGLLSRSERFNFL